MKATEILRYRYRLGLDTIAGIIGSSSRTTWRDVQALRGSGCKAFDKARLPSKKGPGIRNARGVFLTWDRLKTRIRDFILGILDTIYDALEEDPP